MILKKNSALRTGLLFILLQTWFLFFSLPGLVQAGGSEVLVQIQDRLLVIKTERFELKNKIEELESTPENTPTFHLLPAPPDSPLLERYYAKLTQLNAEFLQLQQKSTQIHLAEKFGFANLEGEEAEQERLQSAATALKKSEARIFEKYEVKRKLLHKTFNRYIELLYQKAEHSHERYDNRHFQTLKTKRKLSRAVKRRVTAVALDKINEFIPPFVETFSSKLKALPALPQIRAQLSSLEEKSPEERLFGLTQRLQVESEKIDALKKEIDVEAYKIESILSHGVEFIVSRDKLRKKLLKNFTKILNSSYTPPGMKKEEKKAFQLLKKETLLEGRQSINRAFFSETSEGLSPDQLSQFLDLEIKKITQKFAAHVSDRVNDIKGTYGYLSEWSAVIDTLLDQRRFATLLNEIKKEKPNPNPNENQEKMAELPAKDFQVFAPPYLLSPFSYFRLRVYLRDQKQFLMQEIEKDLRVVQKNLEAKLSEAKTELKSVSSGSEAFSDMNKVHVELLNNVQKKAFTRALQEYFIVQCEELYGEFTRFTRQVHFNFENDFHVLERYRAKALDYYSYIINVMNDAKDMNELNQYWVTFKAGMATQKKEIESWSKKITHKELPDKERIQNLYKLLEDRDKKIHKISELKMEFKELDSYVDSLTARKFEESRNLKLVFDAINEASNSFMGDPYLLNRIKVQENLLSNTQTEIEEIEQTLSGFASASEKMRWIRELRERLTSLFENLEIPEKEAIETLLTRLLGESLTADEQISAITEKLQTWRNLNYQIKESIAMLRRNQDSVFDPYLHTLSSSFSGYGTSYQGYQEILSKKEFPKIQIKNPEVVLQDLRLLHTLLSDLPFEGSRLLYERWGQFAALLTEVLAAQLNAPEIIEEFDSSHHYPRSSSQFSPEFKVPVELETFLAPAQSTLHFFRPLSLPYQVETLVGLANFGTTCYLNTIFKCILTTKLKRFFYPSFSKSGEKGGVEAIRKNMAYFLSTLSTSTTKNKILSDLHTEVVNQVGSLLYLDNHLDWKSIQRDASEILLSLLTQFGGKQDRLYQFDMGTLTVLKDSPPSNFASTDTNTGNINLALDKRFNSIQTLLQNYYKSEKVSLRGSDQFERTSRIVRAPEVLIVSISRRLPDGNEEIGFKDFQEIDVKSPLWIYESELVYQPNENPTKPPHPMGWKEKGSNIQYRLKGSMNHLGNGLESGHYTYAEFDENGDVVIHDDQTVTRHQGLETLASFLESDSKNVRDIPSNCALLIYERVR